ncbi:MAG: M1 family metallopeptidase [Acidobacteriota bacterium]|nr:M1 family metallopeptidase [Acidobacteriota bacterium]
MPSPRPRLVLVLSLLLVAAVLAPPKTAAGQDFSRDKFRQLEEILPTPNAYRTASGAPGHGYWQQRADYRMEIRLDDEEQRIEGSETVSYHNQSPDTLRYLWMQLDPNLFDPQRISALATLAPDFEDLSYKDFAEILSRRGFRGGITIHRVADAAGKPLPHAEVETMMRIDLPEPLGPGKSTSFEVDWSYPLNDAKTMGGRSGYEYFEEDGNYIYEIAQFFPRMAAYTDSGGWQHKQFLGRGEFTLELGNYEVHITVPDDHVLAATGVLQNPDEVLEPAWRRRLEQAESADKPVFVVTQEEAEANEASRPGGEKTWIYQAENVRDFAFASSRKFIWDAQQIEQGGNRVMAMSLYPNEAEPLWSHYSTHAIIHTLEVYSRYTFPYPYPVAISVNGPVGGMEYPMICFNGPRTDDDGTYWDGAGKDRQHWRLSKYGLISVIIHEVGHNFFPMIVNSDERQWTWMDEGLNSFLQFLSEQEWEADYPSRRGEARDIVEFMSSTDQVPIMTNSESLLQFGNNAYAKPATALNILRETILGRELFDFAFREYARRWRFKRPMPADFFRTMEDASGVDLDWFWRGWFYTTDAVDLGIADLHLYELDTRDPEVENQRRRQRDEEEPESITEQRNGDITRRIDRHPDLRDFYTDEYDRYAVTESQRGEYEKLLENLDPSERELLATDARFYVLELENVGGLVMPAILAIEYTDGSSEELRLPAEIWRHDPERVRKLLVREQEIVSIVLDPHRETADIDLDNNHWPKQAVKSRFQLFKHEQEKNPMQEAAETKKGGGRRR